MIRTLRFQGFKALADVTVTLERFTLLVGANGSGKSTVLEGAARMASLMCGIAAPPQSADLGLPGLAHGELPRLATRGHTGRVAIELRGAESGVVADLQPDTLALDRRQLSIRPSGEPFEFSIQAAHHEAAMTIAQRLAVVLHPTHLRLDREILARASFTREITPRVRATGAGLASVLAWLAGNEPETKDAILEDLRRLIPHVRRLKTPRTKVELFAAYTQSDDGTFKGSRQSQEVAADTFELEFDGVGWIPADQLSEGTLLALGLITVMRTGGGPRLLLIDDLERGLHPGAQRTLITQLQTLLAMPAHQETQIIATTHSPFVVDAVPPESVRVMSLDPQGHASCKKLTDHPDWERWRDTMRAGEFWSFVGEAWLFGSPG